MNPLRTSMKQVLLTALAVIGLVLPTLATSQPITLPNQQVCKSTHDLKNINPKDMSVAKATALTPQKMSPGNASDGNLFPVTIKCIFDETPIWGDYNPNLFIGDLLGNYWYIDAETINSSPNRTFTVNLPLGIYHSALCTQINRPECMGMMKFTFNNEILVVDETEAVFDCTTSTHRISFEYCLSNGEKAKLINWSGLQSEYPNDYKAGNCKGISYLLFRSKSNPEAAIQLFKTLGANIPEITGEDAITSNDFFVNIPSGYYEVETAMLINPTDAEICGNSQELPSILSSRTVQLKEEEDIDKTYIQQVGDLVKTPVPLFDHTLCKDQPATYETVLGEEFTYLGEYHIWFMTPFGFANYGATDIYFVDHIMTDLDNETAPLQLQFSSNETSTYDYWTYYDNGGIVTPNAYALKDGTIYYILNSNIAYRWPEDKILCTGWYLPDSFIYNPYYSFSTKDQMPVFGSAAPFFSYTPDASNDPDLTYQFYLDTTLPSFLGNFCESRIIDKLLMNFKVLANGELIIDDFDSFPWLMYDYCANNREAKEITLVFEDSNFEQDGLQGHTYAEVKYKEKKQGDICAPSLQMLQFRNADGEKTTRLDNADESTVSLSYGDFVYQPITQNFTIDNCDIKLEVAPFGTDNYKEIETEEDPSLFQELCWGYFRSAKLSGLGKSENGWWDVRVTLTDAAGNSTFQHISPAFYAKNTEGSGIKGIASETAFFVNGNSITSADGSQASFEIYTLNGAHVGDLNGTTANLSVYENGVYIVKASNSIGTRTFKLAVK